MQHPLFIQCATNAAAAQEPELAKKLDEIAKANGNAVLENAVKNGAEMVITACPLCMYNLNKNATDYDVPVKYFTEVLAEALGLIGE